MIDYNVKPFKRLTNDLIDKLIIHQTISSLRRAIGNAVYSKKVEGNEFIPTIYYLVDEENSKEFSYNCLMEDVVKFLLHKSVTNEPEPGPEPDPDPSPDLFIHSKIDWDGKTGGNLQKIIDGGILMLAGNINYYYQNESPVGEAGNYVGAIITPDKKMLEKYPDFRIMSRGKVWTAKDLIDDKFIIYLKIVISGQEIPIDWGWDPDHIEHFIVAVTQESLIEKP